MVRGAEGMDYKSVVAMKDGSESWTEGERLSFAEEMA